MSAVARCRLLRESSTCLYLAVTLLPSDPHPLQHEGVSLCMGSDFTGLTPLLPSLNAAAIQSSEWVVGAWRLDKNECYFGVPLDLPSIFNIWP